MRKLFKESRRKGQKGDFNPYHIIKYWLYLERDYISFYKMLKDKKKKKKKDLSLLWQFLKSLSSKELDKNCLYILHSLKGAIIKLFLNLEL